MAGELGEQWPDLPFHLKQLKKWKTIYETIYGSLPKWRRLISEDRKAKVDRIHIAEYSVSQRIREKKENGFHRSWESLPWDSEHWLAFAYEEIIQSRKETPERSRGNNLYKLKAGPGIVCIFPCQTVKFWNLMCITWSTLNGITLIVK